MAKSRSQQIDELLEQARQLLDDMQADRAAAKGYYEEMSAWRQRAENQVDQIQQRHDSLEEDLYPHLEKLKTNFSELREEQETTATALMSEYDSKLKRLTSDLETLENQYTVSTEHAEKLRKKIEGLLPGATSAGLASAFKDRKESFSRPKNVWVATFIASIGGLILVAALEHWRNGATRPRVGQRLQLRPDAYAFRGTIGLAGHCSHAT